MVRSDHFIRRVVVLELVVGWGDLGRVDLLLLGVWVVSGCRFWRGVVNLRGCMRIIFKDSKGYERDLAGLSRRLEVDVSTERTVDEILAAVRERGDAAVVAYDAKFGGAKLRAHELRVRDEEFEVAAKETRGKVRSAIRAARRNVADFAKASLRRNWKRRNVQGVETGERFDAFDRVGIYVPGGTAPLVSTAIMTATLAKVAGCGEIVAVTPAGADGRVHPALLTALKMAGATEVYRTGGAQGVAAMAYGTRTIAAVRKIFGPGNRFVVEAKRRLFGTVAVDLLPGPSEVFIIADSSANPAWLAADLLAQSEHGVGSVAVLASASRKLIERVAAEVEEQLGRLSRRKALSEALANAVLIEVASAEEAAALANDFAPEHLTIATAKPDALAKRVTTAGAIFLGDISPVVGGDFVAGPSHELPTGGAGKNFAGLTVDQFQRRTSLVRFSRRSLEKSYPIIRAFSEIEGLDAHGESAAIRLRGS